VQVEVRHRLPRRGTIVDAVAVRLGAVRGGAPATWLHLQADQDLRHAQCALKRRLAKIERIRTAA